jgi:ferredoxin-thioredoxin reductase catalytic subunit
MKVEELLEEIRKHAVTQGFKLNPDEKVVTTILRGLLEKERKYGYRYCPCRPITGDKKHDAQNICPCAWHKKEIEEMGHCLCGLFVKG